MKESNYSFMDGFLIPNAIIAKAEGKVHNAFNWDKAAAIIREKLKVHPDLQAEAGIAVSQLKSMISPSDCELMRLTGILDARKMLNQK